MNVYMINNGNEACCYVRILLPAYNNGFRTDKTSLLSDSSNKLKAIQKDLASSDVVVFHRPESQESLTLIELLKENGKKIVIDNDDTFKIKDNHPLAEWTSHAHQVDIEKRDSFFDKCARKADLMTTTTETLKKEYEEINDNVIILPNCVDPMDWEKPLRNETDKIRIGIVGSVTYSYDYNHVKDVLKKLSDREDVQLVIFGLGDKKHRKENPVVAEHFKKEYDFWDKLDIEQIPWCPVHEYPEKLNEARLDMMIIPRRENYFNKCKSNIKFLEASMCEVPCICQSFEDAPYEELTHGENGLLVKDNADWMKQIDYLINNPDKRRIMGAKAKDYVLDNYDINNKAHLWEEAYKKLCS